MGIELAIEGDSLVVRLTGWDENYGSTVESEASISLEALQAALQRKKAE